VLLVGADDRENEWIGEGMLNDRRNCFMRNYTDDTIALAEHYAISKTPLARGLKVINTDRATVPMRCVLFPVTSYMDINGDLERRSMPKVVF
jgi:DNA excision repair protein ERCC-4